MIVSYPTLYTSVYAITNDAVKSLHYLSANYFDCCPSSWYVFDTIILILYHYSFTAL